MMVAAVSANAQNAVGQWTIQPKAGLGMAAMTNWSNTKMTVADYLKSADKELKVLDFKRFTLRAE